MCMHVGFSTCRGVPAAQVIPVCSTCGRKAFKQWSDMMTFEKDSWEWRKGVATCKKCAVQGRFAEVDRDEVRVTLPLTHEQALLQDTCSNIMHLMCPVVVPFSTPMKATRRGTCSLADSRWTFSHVQ